MALGVSRAGVSRAGVSRAGVSRAGVSVASRQGGGRGLTRTAAAEGSSGRSPVAGVLSAPFLIICFRPRRCRLQIPQLVPLSRSSFQREQQSLLSTWQEQCRRWIREQHLSLEQR